MGCCIPWTLVECSKSPFVSGLQKGQRCNAGFFVPEISRYILRAPLKMFALPRNWGSNFKSVKTRFVAFRQGHFGQTRATQPDVHGWSRSRLLPLTALAVLGIMASSVIVVI